MNETTPPNPDQDPAPLEHADAERVGSESSDPPDERQDEDTDEDPEPPEQARQDLDDG